MSYVWGCPLLAPFYLARFTSPAKNTHTYTRKRASAHTHRRQRAEMQEPCQRRIFRTAPRLARKRPLLPWICSITRLVSDRKLQ